MTSRPPEERPRLGPKATEDEPFAPECAIAIRRGARQSGRFAQLRYGARDYRLSVVASGSVAFWLVRSARLCGVLRAATRSLQRPDRYRRATAQIAGFSDRYSGSRRSGPGLPAVLSLDCDRRGAVPLALSGRAVGGVDRGADDFEPCDAQLDVASPTSECSIGTAGVRGTVFRSLAVGAVVDACRHLRDLSRATSLWVVSVRQDQAAARLTETASG